MRNKRLILQSILALISFFLAMDHISAARSTETITASWSWSNSHIVVELSQRQPDQSRAFFQGRGFSPAESDMIANECVFQVTIRNQHPSEEIMVDLTQWRTILADGKSRSVILEPDWKKKWISLNTPKMAQVAFRWAMFPTTQHFAPGDWNMGMITMGLVSGIQFDLEVAWREESISKLHHIRGLHCALDGADTATDI